MRKITFGPIFVFGCLISLVLAFGIVAPVLALRQVPLGAYRGVCVTAAVVLATYLFAFMVYRLFLAAMPLTEGPKQPGSRDEFAYHVYLLFYMFLFYPLTRSKFIPVPVMRLVYLALGAKLGVNSYSSGTILDPPLTFVGNNTLIGQDAVLYSHAIEGADLSHAAIRIGDNVTIGANAVLMSGVTIGDGAMVASGAVVRKGETIGAGEVWGGVPARLIKGAAANDAVVDD